MIWLAQNKNTDMDEIKAIKGQIFDHLASQPRIDLGVHNTGSHYFLMYLLETLVHDSYFHATDIEIKKDSVKIRINRERAECAHKMSDLPIVKSELIFKGVVRSRLILENIKVSEYCDDYRFWIFSIDLLAHEITEKSRLKLILAGNGWRMAVELRTDENWLRLRDC
jgi:hypothetical protein